MATVMVVDDEPIVRDVVGRYLERDGHRIAAAEDGDSARQLIVRQAPDLVILDVMLPGETDGLALCAGSARPAARAATDTARSRARPRRPNLGREPDVGRCPSLVHAAARRAVGYTAGLTRLRPSPKSFRLTRRRRRFERKTPRN